MDSNTGPLVKSASRSLDIIEYIVSNPRSLSFTAIRQHFDVPKSSLWMLLRELVNRKYIEYDPDTKTYFPGLRLIQIGATCLNNTNISREIALGIKRLSDEFGETTHAGVLDGRHVVYIAKYHGIQDVSAVANIGYRIPAHATAVGKVLLAACPPEEIGDRLAGTKLEQFTENTITDIEKLMGELEIIARQGYAIDNQEIIPGGVCVGVPIVDNTNRTVASISITMKASKLSDDFKPVLISRMKEMARNVSMRLGRI